MTRHAFAMAVAAIAAIMPAAQSSGRLAYLPSILLRADEVIE